MPQDGASGFCSPSCQATPAISRCAHGTLLTKRWRNLRRRDRARLRPADILHVGDLGFDQPVIGIAQRHPPHRLAFLRGPACVSRSDKFVVVAEQPGMLGAERDQDRARQRREIDHEFRLEARLRVPERIGQHEAAFGIGVQDFDGLARHGLDDVVRALRLAVGHVLDEADHAHRVHARLARGQRVHQADDRGGAAHVALHAHHAGAGLERQAAGIEAHALADEGERRLSFAFALRAPFHCMTTRRVSCALPCPTPSSAFMPSFFIAGTSSTSTLTPSFVSALRAFGEFIRVQNIGRLVDQIAGEEHSLAHGGKSRPTACARPPRLLVAMTTVLSVGFSSSLDLAVVIEAVAAQHARRTRDARPAPASEIFAPLGRSMAKVSVSSPLASSRPTTVAASRSAAPRVEGVGLAEPGQHDARGLHAGGRQHLDALPGLALEAADGDGALERAAGCLVGCAPRQASARRRPERPRPARPAPIAPGAAKEICMNASVLRISDVGVSRYQNIAATARQRVIFPDT